MDHLKMLLNSWETENELSQNALKWALTSGLRKKKKKKKKKIFCKMPLNSEEMLYEVSDNAK